MYLCLNWRTAGAGRPLEEFTALAAAAGFDGADVDLSYALQHGPDALRDLYARQNLKFGGWGLTFPWRGAPADYEAGLARLAQYAPLAARLGIDSCANHILPSSDLPFWDNWQFHLQRLGPVARILAAHGLRFGLEFVAPFHLRRKFRHEFIFTPGQALELAAALGPNVGLEIDSFHMYTAGEPWSRIADIPADKIVHVHLNDAPPGPREAAEDMKRALPGQGILDLPAFQSALEKANYRGGVSVEVFNDHLRTLPPQEAAHQALQATRKIWR